MSPKTVSNLRRLYTDTVGGQTYAANKLVHDGLFEGAFEPGYDDDSLVEFIELAEHLTGQKFDFAIKNTRVRIGVAGSWI